jgi:hypothetical protein
VVEEAAHILHGFPSIPPQLGGRMTEDMDSSGFNASHPKVSLKVALESAAGQAFWVA